MTTPLLDDKDLANIDEALLMIESTEADLRKAKDAGLDVEPQERRIAATKDRLGKIRGAFFPNR